MSKHLKYALGLVVSAFLSLAVAMSVLTYFSRSYETRLAQQELAFGNELVQAKLESINFDCSVLSWDMVTSLRATTYALRKLSVLTPSEIVTFRIESWKFDMHGLQQRYVDYSHTDPQTLATFLGIRTLQYE